MILSDKQIKWFIENQTLVTCDIPFSDDQIQPASFDFRLGSSFKCFKNLDDSSTSKLISLDCANEMEEMTTNYYILGPGEFVLGTTMEAFNLPDDMTAFVEGRSSVGRLGLFVQNAGWVDPGFSGEITLELYNASPYSIRLDAGRRIGQLVFAMTGTPVENPYRGKYQGQKGATSSRIYLDGSEVKL